MKLLLPNTFKSVGTIIAPLGFTLWVCMQMGLVTKFLGLLTGIAIIDVERLPKYFHTVNVTVAVTSFCSFLAGMYFLAFSKEKIEDEMIQKTRLDSFQFAAFIQMIFIIVGFLLIIFYKEPNEGGLMLFFITIIFVFWLSFIGRFNYIMHLNK